LPVTSFAQTTLKKPVLLDDCRPCLVSLGGNSDTWAITFDIRETDGERVVRSLRARKQDAKEVTLPVRDMTPVPPGDRFFFGPEDINFDGYKDLLLKVDQGASNAYAVYWAFDPENAAWVCLGRYPLLHVDTERRRVKSFERGGYGGRIYERNEYEFRGLKPVLVRSEKQTLLRAPDRFRRTVRERVNGRMRIVKQRVVSGSTAMPE
jgi:hypothetical protein